MSGVRVIPEPHLTYYNWGQFAWPPNVIADEGVSLYAVHEASVSRDPEGSIYAYLRGPMLKRDGQRGRHQRSLRVSPRPGQPDWLTMLFADAVTRLPAAPESPAS